MAARMSTPSLKVPTLLVAASVAIVVVHAFFALRFAP
jgi:hypothetical protein